MKYFSLLVLLAGMTVLGAGIALAVQVGGKTGVVVDEQAGMIHFLSGGKEIALIDADGLSVRGHISYGGYLRDDDSLLPIPAVQP